MRDASLDEFLSDTDEESEAEEEHASGRENGGESKPEGTDAEPGPESESGSETGAGGEDEGLPPATDVDPARSTYAWSPDGTACDACGERVEERWEAEAGLVCISCKEW